MSRISLWLLAVVTTVASGAAVVRAADSDRIAYNNRCFIIDGKETFLYSGSFHYFRCPKPLWADRFQKMKDAGLNCVETYVAWNWHERQPPDSLDDFSKMDMSDLTDWLEMAVNKFGFYVILRPGPYICAEWDGGGYPQWLITKKTADAPENWLRGDEPTYLAWCRHWYAAAAKASVPFQITHRSPSQPGGVILWQIENEYNYADFAAEVKLHQLQSLAHDSRDFGIDVPLVTCMTDDPLYKADPFLSANVIECRNTYPNWEPSGEISDLTFVESYQPDKPRLVTELQGGWFSDIGRKLSEDMGYTPQQITHVTLLAWAHGFTGTNYYMMFGGTNLGDWGAAYKTTSYDCAAPIREWGGVGPRYFAVQAMANFLKEHANQLIHSKQIECSDEGEKLPDVTYVLRRGDDGSHFLFVFNNLKERHLSGTLHLNTSEIASDVRYDLEPFDARILYLPPNQTNSSTGQWYPQTVTPPQRPTDLPADVPITEVKRQIDPGPPNDSWRDLPPNAGIESMGIFDRRFVFYRANFDSTLPKDLTVRLQGQDGVIGQSNGNALNFHQYGQTAATKLPQSSSGENHLLLLYANGGRDNGGAGINASCGLHGLDPSLHWQISGESAGSAGNWQDPRLADSDWQTIKLPESIASDPPPVHLVWYRLRFDLPEANPHVWVPWKLHLESTGNGFIYLNGHALGRYWQVGPQHDFYLPECWLNFGPGSSNVVTLCLRPTSNSPQISSANVSPYRQFAENR